MPFVFIHDFHLAHFLAAADFFPLIIPPSLFRPLKDGETKIRANHGVKNRENTTRNGKVALTSPYAVAPSTMSLARSCNE